MLRFGLMAAALCFALVTHSAAFAQAPENPNDAVPDAMPFDVPYGDPIDLATAKKVAAAAVAEAQKHGNWKMNIAIVGPSGDLLYFERMDGAQLASVQISQHKARVSARYRRPTLAFEQGMGRGSSSPISARSMTSWRPAAAIRWSSTASSSAPSA